MTELNHAERAYIGRQIRMAEKRLAMVNVELTRGHDPRLIAESELLSLQLAGLRRELEG